MPTKSTSTHPLTQTPKKPDSRQQAALKAHLQRLHSSRAAVRSILDAADPNHEMASASLAITWELVFGTLCLLDANRPPELDFMRDFVTVLQKLTSSYNQLKTLELKIQQSTQPAHTQALGYTLAQTRNQSAGLSQELLEQLEASLKLL